ncbi:quinone oxidoreductase [Azospirillum sp. RWY-5-1]|uniref:Quinone oxidoreductase n=1 Tax=Azospirillum oleiclasticum TaxID=2735135 RepID=A0ABX2T828_9PROT|nr:quinone oxidoreductase [Azospirillum oleiclasticum]NYZ13095.1 quinone oxidoreductase [Azospirillum oleiclasticum]NYZ20232.1 quinone oxidoreductase [Azospirillum oleiclasticum]
MVHAIRIHETGGPEVLRWEEVEVGEPGPGQVRLRHTAVGLNYIDTYHRTGAYKVPLPSGLGLEGAGVVEAVGPDVTEYKAGDRVAYCTGPIGAYSEVRLMPTDKLIPLPSWIEDRQAAAMMLQGLTAQFLLRQTYVVKPGDTILVQAAAGGVGQILCQWAKHLGATVIGTVSTDEKAELARANGCDHPIVYTRESFLERVKDITAGKGVPVVYDGVGKTTFMDGLDCLAPRGLMALFGAASGPVPPLDLQLLAAKGSLYVTRPTLFVYMQKREDLMAAAADLFDVVNSGGVTIRIGQTFPLKDAADAHRALESRGTTGSTILVP